MNALRLSGFMVAAVLLATGCGTTKPSRFFQLNDPRPEAPAALAPEETAWVIRSVRIPPYLDRTPMLLRKGPYELEVDEYSRWAEPLEAGLARLLADSRPKPGEAAWLVEVEVILFDVDVSGEGLLEARWSARPARNGGVVYGAFRRTRRGDQSNPEDRARILSALAIELRESIASRLAAVEGEKKKGDAARPL